MCLFGVSGILLIAGSTRDRRVQALGLLFLVIASAFTTPLLVLLRGSPFSTLAALLEPLYAEAFLALALWQFVWLFPSEPKPHWARTIGKTFLVVASAVGISAVHLERAVGADDHIGDGAVGKRAAVPRSPGGDGVLLAAVVRGRGSGRALSDLEVARGDGGQPAEDRLVRRLSRLRALADPRRGPADAARAGAEQPVVAGPCRGDRLHRARVDRADDGLCRGGQPRHGSAPRDSPHDPVRAGEDIGVVRHPAAAALPDVRRVSPSRAARRGIRHGPAALRADPAVAGQLRHPDIPAPDPSPRGPVVQPGSRRSHRVARTTGTGASLGAHDSRHLRHPEARDRARCTSQVGRGADGGPTGRTTRFARECGPASAPGLGASRSPSIGSHRDPTQLSRRRPGGRTAAARRSRMAREHRLRVVFAAPGLTGNADWCRRYR